MYCKNCGSYNIDENVYCEKCGKKILGNNSVKKESQNFKVERADSKLEIGALMALLLSIIGLIIGLVIYTNEYHRRTFLRGWITTFVILCVIGLFVLGVVLGISACYACS